MNDPLFSHLRTRCVGVSQFVLEDFEPSTPLPEVIRSNPPFFDYEFKESIIKQLLGSSTMYLRFSSSRIFIKEKCHDLVIRDCVDLDQYNYRYLFDSYCGTGFPLLTSLTSLSNNDKDHLIVRC